MWKPTAPAKNLPADWPPAPLIPNSLSDDQNRFVVSALRIVGAQYTDAFKKILSGLLIADGNGPPWTDKAVEVNAIETMLYFRDVHGVVESWPAHQNINPARAALAPAVAVKAAATVNGP